MPVKPTFVVVGAGTAGAKAVETLREEGFEGRIVLLGAEPERPYERPPLSKDYIRDESAREEAFIHPENFYADREIELHTSSAVRAIALNTSEVVLQDERLRFDRLLLATGAAPRRLALPGAELDGVLYLRDMDDAAAIRRRLAAGGRVVIVGGGWIGMEVAASARQRGLDVTVIDLAPVPFQRVLGPEVGAVFRDLHRDHGVELLAEAEVAALEGDGAVSGVVLGDGRRIQCDFVVVGIGVAPRIDLAREAGIAVGSAILVDERLETSVPGIFAAGDVAEAEHPLLRRRVRVEHWANARHQGPAAARAMLGAESAYDRLPYFFSDQYDVSMEYFGHAHTWDGVVFRGDPSTREFLTFWLAGDRVVAGMSVNVPQVAEPIQQMIRERAPVDPDRLRDPDVALEDIALARSQPDQGAVKSIFAQGINYTRRVVGDRLSKADPTPVSRLAPGEAKVLQLDGDKVGVYRDDSGELHAVSPVCTHMGCVVDWNGGERTWDCPCHGARFHFDGTVLKGPAKKDLKRRAVSNEAA